MEGSNVFIKVASVECLNILSKIHHYRLSNNLKALCSTTVKKHVDFAKRKKAFALVVLMMDVTTISICNIALLLEITKLIE